MNEKYQAVKVSRSLQMTLSEIAVRQLIIQFRIEKQYSKRTYQIETSFSGESDLFLSNLKEKMPEKLQSFQQRHMLTQATRP